MSIKDSVFAALSACKGTFLSGEALSAQLSVSRTAIWKAIKSLREEGYPIESSTNKGYMLMEDRWHITEESLRLCMPADKKNIPIHIYETLDSTNNKAKQLVLEGAPHGTVVLAWQQTGGRGRLGRSFHSPREGIYLSIIIKPDFHISKATLVTSAAAVAVAESIEAVCGVTAGIKWVNDVYVNGKKVCGILTEGTTGLETGQIESLIIGIGINTTTKDFPAELQSIAGAVEGTFSRSALAASVISKTLDLAAAVEERHFIDAYRKKSLVIGKTVQVFRGKYAVDPTDELPSRPARVLGIDDDGGLEVLYSDGRRETLISGEISIRL